MSTQAYSGLNRPGWLTFAAVVMFAVAFLRIISAIYYFFEIMGRGFFVLVLYVALLGFLETRRAAGRGVGRNAKCPCGSGRKFKHCCGTG